MEEKLSIMHEELAGGEVTEFSSRGLRILHSLQTKKNIQSIIDGREEDFTSFNKLLMICLEYVGKQTHNDIAKAVEQNDYSEDDERSKTNSLRNFIKNISQQL